jgi:hypothetical protein
MNTPNERTTPPKQSSDDPNMADRRLSEEQRKASKNEPEKPEPGKGRDLPDPKDVGEAG